MARLDTLVGLLLGAAALVLIGALIVLSVRSDGGSGHRQAALEPAVPVEQVNVAADLSLVANVDAITRPDSPNRIVIGSIDLDAPVVEVGVIVENGKPVWDTAAFAVGYHRGTALPGTRGNTVLAGHISSPVSKKGDIFKRLPEVRIGDRVEIHAGDRRVSYQIKEIRVVAPTEVQVMNPTEEATVTLITCYPDREYSHRLVVIGSLAGLTEVAERLP